MIETDRKRELDQERLLPFLSDPASYPHHPDSVRLIQTHASFVFLAPPYVYKIKKAVDFGFLDFSTLERRRYFCEREITLNRRLTQDVYLEVLPISEASGTFHFGENGKTVEFAVKMRLLAKDGFLDRRLERGEVTVRDLDRIVAMLTNFYAQQDPGKEIAERGLPGAVRESTDGNFRQTEEFVGSALSPAAYDAIRYYTERFYERHGALFEERVRQGRILDCHGDLHLEHIHLGPQTLNIYDCIEFNDNFRYVDVANDVAFLAMDLDFRRRPDLSRCLVERIAERLEDARMSHLMDFYKCYRAYVRGKVECLHSVAHAAPKEEKEASAERAQSYFRLALRYATADSDPLVLVVMGRIAVGKSTLAKALADELGWELFSSDRMRKTLAGIPLLGRGTASAREQLYAPEMSERTYEALLKAADEHAREGRSVVLDATFGSRSHRDRLRSMLSECTADHCFLEVQAADSVIRERLALRESQADVVSDARLEDFTALANRCQAPAELPPHRLGVIDANGSLESSVRQSLRFLADRQAAKCQDTAVPGSLSQETK